MDVATAIDLSAIGLAAAAAAAAVVVALPSSLFQSTVAVFFVLVVITAIANKKYSTVVSLFNSVLMLLDNETL